MTALTREELLELAKEALDAEAADWIGDYRNSALLAMNGMLERFAALLSQQQEDEKPIAADAGGQQAAREQPADERKDAQFRVDLSEEQATRLRDYIGNGDREITLAVIDARAGRGLYALDTDYLDEGCEFICALAEKGERK